MWKSIAIAVSCAAATIALPASSGVAEPTTSSEFAATNWIRNITPNATKIGVIHVRDGNYTYGTHDALLPRDAYTHQAFGWTTTAGWYTGPGWCTAQWRSSDGAATFTRQLPDLGSGQHFIGAHTYYIVMAYRC